LKADALNSLKLPVTVKAGFVGTITLKVANVVTYSQLAEFLGFSFAHGLYSLGLHNNNFFLFLGRTCSYQAVKKYVESKSVINIFM
jgi:hypothetical protein